MSNEVNPLAPHTQNLLERTRQKVKYIAGFLTGYRDGKFARRIVDHTDTNSWISLDVKPISRHIAIVVAVDRGDILGRNGVNEHTVARRLVFAKGNAEQKAIDKAEILQRVMRDHIGRRIFSVRDNNWPDLDEIRYK